MQLAFPEKKNKKGYRKKEKSLSVHTVVSQKVLIEFSVALRSLLLLFPSCIIVLSGSHTHTYIHMGGWMLSQNTKLFHKRIVFKGGFCACALVGGLGFYRMGLCVWEIPLAYLWNGIFIQYTFSFCHNGATNIRIYHTLDWRGVFFFCSIVAGQGRAEGLVFLMSFFNPSSCYWWVF